MARIKNHRQQPCVAGLNPSGGCPHSDCAEAHEVRCCGDCPERAHCMSGCEYPGKPEREIRVWVKEPGKAPEVRRIPNTLDELQDIVDGRIDVATVYVGKTFMRPYTLPNGRKERAVTFVRDLAVICNEEGRIIGLPSNVKIAGERFVGTIVIAGVSGEEFADAPEEDVLRMIFPHIWRAADRKEAEA